MPLTQPMQSTLTLRRPSDTAMAGERPLAKAAASASGAGSTACAMRSSDILRGQKTVEISHNGLTYRLQATRLGKLILTK